MMARWLALLALLATAACVSPGWRPSLDDNQPGPWRRVDLSALPVALPRTGSPAVVQARARDIGAVYRITHIVFANGTTLPGENRLDIDLERTPSHLWDAIDRPVRPYSIPLYTSDTLTAALAREFPGLTAALAPAPRSNRYGVYDYAVARGAKGICVLAWQLIRDDERVLPEGVPSIRMEWRRCEPSGTEDDLLRPFDRLTLLEPQGILPAGE